MQHRCDIEMASLSDSGLTFALPDGKSALSLDRDHELGLVQLRFQLSRQPALLDVLVELFL